MPRSVSLTLPEMQSSCSLRQSDESKTSSHKAGSHFRSGNKTVRACWATFPEKGHHRRSKSRVVFTEQQPLHGLQAAPPPLTFWGQALPFRVKGSKKGAEYWKQGTEVLGNLITMCEAKRVCGLKLLQKCEE